MQVRIQPDRSLPAGPKKYSCREGGAGNPAALGGMARIGRIAAALWLCVAFAPVFAVSFRPDELQVAVSGFDGMIRLCNAETGAVENTFPAAPVTPATPPAATPAAGG